MINLHKVEYDLSLEDRYPQDACYLAGFLPKLKHLKRWEQPRDYFGAEWPEYYSAGVGRHRDSDCLERSNFVQMLEELGGENGSWGYDVRVVRENHWAVGWVEWIAIHQSSYGALAIADRLKGKLEDYPVLNEEHWSALELEEANQTWKECYSPKERIKYIREHRDQHEFSSFQDLLACVRGHYFAGYPSELLHA